MRGQPGKGPQPYDTVSAIMSWEEGQMDPGGPEEVEFFTNLLRTGMINHLQGSYGRRAAQLIAEGLIVHGPPAHDHEAEIRKADAATGRLMDMATVNDDLTESRRRPKK